MKDKSMFRSGSILLVLLMLTTACQSGVPPVPTATPDAGQTPAAPDAAEATPTPDAATAAIITAVAIQTTRSPVPAPVASRAALPTAVPPGRAVEPAATDLQTKLAALRTALRTQDVSTALKLQRQLLASSDQAEAAMKDDKSAQAQAVRAAIADLRAAAAGGDSNGYDHAEASLRQLLGGTTPGASLTVTTQGNTPTEVSTDIHTIADQVRGLRQAIQGRNAGEALRLQAALVSEIEAAQKGLDKDSSDDSKTLKAALGDLQKGLDGDVTRLAAASLALDKLDGPVTADRAQQPTTDVAQAATTLGSKIDAFRAAASTKSKADLLRLQDDILTEVDHDRAALALDPSDQTPATAAFKQALNDVRVGVSGDLTKLDGARANLAKAAGQDVPAATAGATSTDAAKPIADLSKFAADLDNTVSSFQTAVQKDDTGSLLRLRKQLSDQAAQVDANLKDAQNRPADEVRAAVASIRTAFAGDLTKLDEAHVHLRAVASGTVAQPGANAAATKTPELQGVTGALREKLASLAAAVRDQKSPDEIATKRDAVKTAAAQAQAALTGSTDPRADRLRTAISTANEAAGGDDTKASSAQTALDAAVNAH
jgi:hypothetical protein